MSTELVRAAGTLVAGLVLWLVAQGDWRRRARREIREELELLRLLGGGYEDVAGRLRERIAAKLEEYEPGPDHVRHLPISAVWLIAAAAGMAVTIPVLGAVDDEPWLSPLLGALVGAVATLTASMVTRRRVMQAAKHNRRKLERKWLSVDGASGPG